MSTKNVTITSKNQVTLPAEYVRTLGLVDSRVLQAEIKDNKIVLSPVPNLVDAVKPFWGKHSAKRPLSDTQLKQAIRRVAAKKAGKGQ